jgi:peptide/nickel transport system permease protein
MEENIVQTTNVAESATVKLVARQPQIGWYRRILHSRKATIGLVIVLFFMIMGIFAPVLAQFPPSRMVGKSHAPPNAEHWLGTTRTGQDVFSQVVYGARTSILVGVLTGTMVTIIFVLIGVTAGYVGGTVDDALSLLINVVLVLPALPLIIVVARYIEKSGPITIVLVLSFTSWAWGARVLRSMTLTLRESEFVSAARVIGEPIWRIVLVEILPNMTSLVVSGWIGAVIYAVLTEAGLEFIGLGNPNLITWGTILYWAQNNAALLTKAWWTFIPPGLCIALLGFGFTMINFGIDEITNPRLQGQ